MPVSAVIMLKTVNLVHEQLQKLTAETQPLSTQKKYMHHLL